MSTRVGADIVDGTRILAEAFIVLRTGLVDGTVIIFEAFHTGMLMAGSGYTVAIGSTALPDIAETTVGTTAVDVAFLAIINMVIAGGRLTYSFGAYTADTVRGSLAGGIGVAGRTIRAATVDIGFRVVLDAVLTGGSQIRVAIPIPCIITIDRVFRVIAGGRVHVRVDVEVSVGVPFPRIRDRQGVLNRTGGQDQNKESQREAASC